MRTTPVLTQLATLLLAPGRWLATQRTVNETGVYDTHSTPVAIYSCDSFKAIKTRADAAVMII